MFIHIIWLLRLKTYCSILLNTTWILKNFSSLNKLFSQVVNATVDSILLWWTPGGSNRPAPYRNAITQDSNQQHSQDSVDDDQELSKSLLDVEYVSNTERAVGAASLAVDSDVGYIVQYRSELTGTRKVGYILLRQSIFQLK